MNADCEKCGVAKILIYSNDREAFYNCPVCGKTDKIKKEER
jgi:predicted RNA-binding Zn-ribbon protein involved in translation (DUF1610 family)